MLTKKEKEEIGDICTEYNFMEGDMLIIASDRTILINQRDTSFHLSRQR